MFRVITLFSIFLLLAACKNEPAKKTAPPLPPPPPAPVKINLPSIPDATVKYLYDNCDYIDYTFYDPRLPMSISLNEISSIRGTLGHISKSTPTPLKDCKALGRIFYQKQGEYILEAEFHYAKDCTYFVFFKDGKPTYANNMSEAGQNFFNTNISQALKAVQGRQ